ncbi:MAG: cellulose biosynthesis protein BcsS, partial [Syntrophales bacterium]
MDKEKDEMKSYKPRGGHKSGIRVFTISLAFIIVSFVFCPFSLAADVFTFAGGEIDGHGQSFSYLGVDVTEHLDKTFAVAGRIIPNYLTYKYYSGDNTLIKASSPGVFAVGGMKLFWDKSMLGIYGGLEFRSTGLDPDDTNNSARGDKTGGVIQGEFDSWLTNRTNLNIFASYGGVSDFLYEKGRLKQQVTNLDYKKSYSWFVGVEQFVGRNSDFDEQGVGLALELF